MNVEQEIKEIKNELSRLKRNAVLIWIFIIILSFFKFL